MSYNETTGIIEVESNKQKYVSSVGVYNFEVENTHSYFVGENRVWVHNYEESIPTKPVDYEYKKREISEVLNNFRNAKPGVINGTFQKVKNFLLNGEFVEDRVINYGIDEEELSDITLESHGMTAKKNEEIFFEGINKMTDSLWFDSDGGKLKVYRMKNEKETKILSASLLNDVLINPKYKNVLNIVNEGGYGSKVNVIDSDDISAKYNGTGTGAKITIDVGNYDGERSAFHDPIAVKDDDGKIRYEYIPLIATLGHEFIHAQQVNTGTSLHPFQKVLMKHHWLDGKWEPSLVPVNASELHTISSSTSEIEIYGTSTKKPIPYLHNNKITENSIRKEHGVPIRLTYHDDKSALKALDEYEE
ncbi:MAG: hypothetical protein H7A25_25875 [Leptospiraceae bacterium]|nr:hypothetical protein [Leptospiraceae bacterium]